MPDSTSPPRLGRITSFVFLLGVVAIYFAPDTSKRDMAE